MASESSTDNMDNAREKIVIIEADPAALETIRSALDTAGYDVAAFGSSVEALEIGRASCRERV